MYLGRLVEEAPNERLFAATQHPYTVSLLSAVPGLRPGGRRGRRILLEGELPSPADPPTGCGFHPRCPIARPRCATEEPPLGRIEGGHAAACFYPGEPIVGASDVPA
jgi:peptide/nickel transport system ATP-binding protein